ncbi:MAG: ABC transporter permease [Clostridiales Family XIII bacterium]|nr:ABC transporter permease [Clostridiales Family XIII bacterium]
MQNTKSFSSIANRFGVFLMIAILLVVGTFASKNFWTPSNFLNILSAVAILGIVAAGMSFVIYCGKYGDMSVPMTMAISGVIAVELMRYGLVPAFAGALCTGLIIGVINGIVIGKLKVNAIIWTLALNFIIEGLVRWSYGGSQLYPDMATADTYKTGFLLRLMPKLDPHVMDIDLTARAADFNSLAQTYFWGGIPLMLIVMVCVMVAGWFVLSRSTYGAKLKIVGSNYNVGSMSGIRATSVVMGAFMISSLCAALAGVFITSMNKVGAYYVGSGYDFQAVTAIILGGMSLAGGRGNHLGVFGGVFTMGLISNILTLFGIGTFTQKMITGAIFIVVVAVNASSLRKLGRDDA